MTIFIAVWDPKGGCCKTTTTINVAATAVLNHNKKVLVVALDHAATMGKYNTEPYPFDVQIGMPDKAPQGYDLVIFDYPAGHNKALPAMINLIVCPIIPTGEDFAVYSSYKHLIEGRNKIEVLQRVQSPTKRDKNEAFLVEQIEKNDGYVIEEVTPTMRRASNLFTHVHDKRLARRTRIGNLRRHYRILTNKILSQAA